MSTCQSSDNTSRPFNINSRNNTNASMPSTAILVHSSDNSPVLESSSSHVIINNHNPEILIIDGTPVVSGTDSPALSSGSPLMLSSGSPQVLSSNSSVVLSSGSPVGHGNSAGYSPIISTPHSTPSNISLPQPGLSDHVLSLARSVTPFGSWPSSKVVPIVHISCGSSWDLRGASRHSNKNKKEETKEPKEPCPYFIDQDTGKRYKKDGKLGEGGFGLLYRVVDGEGKTYALKTFKADSSGRDFRREIDMFVAAGPNDNLLKFFGAVQDLSGKFLLFDLCRPHDLSDLLCSCGRLTYPEVRIGDLGLPERYNLKGGFRGPVGTKHFVAPEVVNREPHTYHLNTFSFGCVIYMMLLDTKPHLTTLGHTYPTRLEDDLYNNQKSKEPEDRLSADAQALLRALLSFNPPTRPKPSHMVLEKFYLEGHCPTKLTEDVFHTPYTPINEHKRKDAPTEEETKVVQKTKLDDLDDPNF